MEIATEPVCLRPRTELEHDELVADRVVPVSLRIVVVQPQLRPVARRASNLST